MQKQFSWPEGHWNWPIDINNKHGVRCGNMIWVGGQVDLNAAGEVQNSDALEIQIANVVRNFDRVLQEFHCALQDLVFLNCFYVNDGSLDEGDFLDLLATELPEQVRTAITVIPVPALCYDGLMLE